MQLKTLSEKKDIVYLYCDGACRGNPGPGGWGVLLRYNGHECRLYGGVANTTNNQMEITAAIEGLKALKRRCHVIITTDSQYLRQGAIEWLSVWGDRQWKTSNKKPVKNKALWEALKHEIGRHTIIWHWVKGHSGHVKNEIADRLAKRGIDEIL